MKSKSGFWLFKTEPTTYSFDRLMKEKSTNWNGVRNFQARNFLREASTGDLAIIYHSGDDKAAVGIARVIRAAYKDPDPDGGDWVQIDLEAVERFKAPIELSAIKSDAGFKDLALIKQSRLSCMPISSAHFARFKKLGGVSK